MNNCNNENEPQPDRQVVCHCAGVTAYQIDAELRRDAACSLDSLGQSLGCGVQCGSCVPALCERLGLSAWHDARVSRMPLAVVGDARAREQLICRVDFELPAPAGYPAAKAGQHVVVRAVVGSERVERTYTIIGHSADRRMLSIAVRRVPSGGLTPWLLDDARSDADIVLCISEPAGSGLAPKGDKPLVLLVGGIGVTPAVSLLALAPDAEVAYLDYSARTREDMAFVDRFEARRAEDPRFDYRLRETRREERLSAREASRIALRYRGASFIACGPEEFLAAVSGGLRDAGVPTADVHLERFSVGHTARRTSPPSRIRSYLLGMMLAALPPLLLLPALASQRPHGPPNTGHEKLECEDCHQAAEGSTRQQLQAKVRHAIGLRESAVEFGNRSVVSGTCTRCHQNPDDRHAAHRFLEPRFEQARQQLGAHQCVSCHREHSARRVTAAQPGYCAQCHHDLKVKDDKASPSHALLIQDKRWETCLQCHDYHGNHGWKAPLRLEQALELQRVQGYLAGEPSPFGEPLVKSKEPE